MKCIFWLWILMVSFVYRRQKNILYEDFNKILKYKWFRPYAILYTPSLHYTFRSPFEIQNVNHQIFEMRMLSTVRWNNDQKLLISIDDWIEIIRKTFSEKHRKKKTKKIIIVLYLWLFKQWMGFTASSISRITNDIKSRDHIPKSIEIGFLCFFFYDILTINQMSFWLLLLLLLNYSIMMRTIYTLNVKSHFGCLYRKNEAENMQIVFEKNEWVYLRS